MGKFISCLCWLLEKNPGEGKGRSSTSGRSATASAGSSRPSRIITREMGKPMPDPCGNRECAWLVRVFRGAWGAVPRNEGGGDRAEEADVVSYRRGLSWGSCPGTFCSGRSSVSSFRLSWVATFLRLRMPRRLDGAGHRAGFTDSWVPDHVFQTLFIDPPRPCSLWKRERVDGVVLHWERRGGYRDRLAAGGRWIGKIRAGTRRERSFHRRWRTRTVAVGRTALQAPVINSGQSCIAAKRFIVMEPVAGVLRKSRRKGMKPRTGDRWTRNARSALAKWDWRPGFRPAGGTPGRGAALRRPPPLEGNGFLLAGDGHRGDPDMRVAGQRVLLRPVRILAKSEEHALETAYSLRGLGAFIWYP